MLNKGHWSGLTRSQVGLPPGLTVWHKAWQHLLEGASQRVWQGDGARLANFLLTTAASTVQLLKSVGQTASPRAIFAHTTFCHGQTQKSHQT